MRAIEDKDDLSNVLPTVTQEIEKLMGDMGTPVQQLATPEGAEPSEEAPENISPSAGEAPPEAPPEEEPTPEPTEPPPGTTPPPAPGSAAKWALTPPQKALAKATTAAGPRTSSCPTRLRPWWTVNGPSTVSNL